jgi:putative tryptophan/tyrosine transport system substrate-binding protein
LLPSATNIAVLVNPSSAAITEQFLHALQSAAHTLGMQLHVMQASTDHDLDLIFATMRTDAVVIGLYLFFVSRMEQLGALSLRHAVPAWPFATFRRRATIRSLST